MKIQQNVRKELKKNEKVRIFSHLKIKLGSTI